MLTADQRASFAAHGLLRLPGALEPDVAGRMCEDVWEFLDATQGIRADDASTWATSRPTRFGRLSRTGTLDRLWSPVVENALEDLLGEEPQHRERPRVLMTLPHADTAWTVPSAGWHFDFTPLQRRPGLRAIQVFALLGDVDHRGGGTLVLAGSHRLVARYAARTGNEPRPRPVRESLGARHPQLSELWALRDDESGVRDRRTDRLLEAPVVVDGVELRIVEVTGTAGDVYLMNSDCFHTIAPNARPVARVMCTSLVTRTPSGR